MLKGVLLLTVVLCSYCLSVTVGQTTQRRRVQRIRNRVDVLPTEASSPTDHIVVPVNEDGEEEEQEIDGDEVDGDREVPIIKQINRVNDDGTYTFGYEAADGSFKIETRDVLGNVKGMFGFIDKNGELKRVSYSASNATGFSATGNIRSLPPESVTRRPVLVYRGTTPVVQHIPGRNAPTTTASTPLYDFGRRNRGYESTTTETPKPVKVLVTRRPSLANALRENTLIRRQLGLDRSQDSHDVYSSGSIPQRPLPRGYRYPQTVQDQRQAYRNMLLEENNLKPDYPPAPVRSRYYAPQSTEDEAYPEVPAVVPMVDRVLGAKRAYRPPPPPGMVDVSGYPVQQIPRRSLGYAGGYSARGAPPPPYDPYYPPFDFEALRDEIMNYLLQYLQYRTRRPPYAPIPPPAAAQGYYGPQLPSAYPDYYEPPVVNPRYYPLDGRFPPGPGGLPPLGPPVTQSAYPFVGPNVQYSDGGDVAPSTTVKPQNPTPQASERIIRLKERMDSSDHRDTADTRPPSPGLIRMLLARPSTYRPTVRSIEIIGSSASEHIPVSTAAPASSTTTTEASDEMIASS